MDPQQLAQFEKFCQIFYNGAGSPDHAEAHKMLKGKVVYALQFALVARALN